MENKEEDKETTAFASTREGLYKYVAIFFGLYNAPTTVQRLVERLLVTLQ